MKCLLSSRSLPQKEPRKNSPTLVSEFVCVSVHPVLRREGRFVEMAAVVPAFTGLDEHGGPLEALAVWADKGHRYGACAAWRAAPAVCTHTTVVGPVEADAQAFAVGQADGLWGFVCWGTLLSFLGWDG